MVGGTALRNRLMRRGAAARGVGFITLPFYHSDKI